ncbi:MAG: class I SAM-dependent methyltransferase [Lachnospiraceae bacterium]|nr:class I SAM-dependent methyltransferase [Lachnospiraceae bacterium]
MRRFTVTDFCHQFISSHISEGSFCIDATAGNGHDTEFLCRLTGDSGKVLAFDIQEQAVTSTRKRLDAHQLSHIGQVIPDSHAHLDQYAAADSVDCIMFNFGYLPGGDHAMATRPDTSLTAIKKSLNCLKPGGLLCLCIYSGGDTGYAERDTILPYIKGLDPREYLVIISSYANRPGDPPIPAFIFKQVR